MYYYICISFTGKSHVYYNSSLSYDFPSTPSPRGYTFPSVQAPLDDIPCQIILTDRGPTGGSPLYRQWCDEGRNLYDNVNTWAEDKSPLTNYKSFFPNTNNEIPLKDEYLFGKDPLLPLAQYVFIPTVIEIKDGYNKKYCLVLILIYFVVLMSIFFVLALVFKYHIEKIDFEKKF